MEKLNMHTPDLVSGNIEKIAALFPSAVTEMRGEDGKIKRGINFEVLKQLLSRDVVDGDERYEFTWVGKKQAIAEAARPITKTLRPVKEDSRNWDTTENLYIEGDNQEVLKILQESYLGKVKMIYIDPPYNTGKDFIYRDNFRRTQQNENEQMGMFEEEDTPLFENTETNGRFHSDWCSMIYSRLSLARNLLSEDGVIFISIDDNEFETLYNICNEIFCETNAVTPFIWPLPRGINAGLIARAHEYILVYAKNLKVRKNFNRTTDDAQYSIERCNKKIDSRHPQSIIEFPAGVPYEGKDQVLTGIIEGSESITIVDKLVFKNGALAQPAKLSAGWTMKNMILDWLAGKEVYDLKGQKIERFFFKENGRLYSQKTVSTLSIKSVLKDIPDTQIARKELAELLGSPDIFPYPKAIALAKLFAKLSTNENDIILDFFSGSATTAHAVMQLNAEDGGHRKFIMVQLPEPCDEKSEAYKAGYKNICEIGKERIRRAGDKIQSEHPNAKIDTGFRVFRVAESNMEDVYYHPEELTQTMLGGMVSNIKPDRTDLDLLYACLLDWGVEINLPHTAETIDGCTVHNVDDGALVACFDENVPESVIHYMAELQPLRAVFRDSSFASDDSKINVTEIFKNVSPDTKVKVI